MGTQSILTGEITIEPPLNADEIRALGDRTDAFRRSEAHSVLIPVETAEEATPDGVLTRWSARRIVPGDRRSSVEGIDLELRAILDEIGTPERTLAGSIRGVTDDGLAWRVRYVKADGTGGAQVAFEEPSVLWPEDTAAIRSEVLDAQNMLGPGRSTRILDLLDAGAPSGDGRSAVLG
jgi:hypothetical protein